jgi:hypothetical protein
LTLLFDDISLFGPRYGIVITYIIMAAGAWYQALFFIALDLLIILGAWLNGIAGSLNLT